MTKHSIFHIAFIFLISIGYAFAQNNNAVYWQPKIIDFSTDIPLETANISINRKTDYPINNEGLAKIPLSKINEGDSIFVSCMGYNILSLFISNRNDFPLLLKLKPISYSLREVEVSKTKNKLKETIIGTKAFSISTVRLTYNSSYGFYINNNDKKKGYIKGVSIRMFDRYNGIDMPFKLRLFKKTSSEPFPQEELMEPMVVQNTKKKKWFSIDISHLGLKLPEDGFFIVFEVLGKEYYNDKKVRVFGTLSDELPSFGFTTFPKDVNKENYAIIKLDNKKWFLARNAEYQFQAKILLDN